MSRALPPLLLALVAAGAWWLVGAGRSHPPPGVAAPEFPRQTVLVGTPEHWQLAGGYEATALADYRIHARVLGVETYHYDAGATVAPVDLALGWGEMSDWAIYSRLNISQRGRYYLYEWGADGPPIAPADIITHSANNHIIPADAEVAKILSTVRVHDVVWLEGQLVEVRGPNGFTWRSSLTRTDTGGGACELFRVSRLAVEPPAPPQVDATPPAGHSAGPPMPDPTLTRNFCIIAHIDHGKTTLSDRLLQVTGTVADRDAQEQHLDSMDLERERGITIKMHPVAMQYRAKDGNLYKLNLLDTPGHVDFAYEVSRSLAACEGALVIVDAAQGVEAQTVATVHLANKQGLTIIPVINKIDLPNSDIPSVKRQLEEILSIPAEEAILASAKAGIGIEDILEAVIQRIPPPKQWDDEKVRALVFDSTFDSYRGVVTYVRVMSGVLRVGDGVKMMSNNRPYDVKEVGVFTPKMRAMPQLEAGDTGYVIANIKASAEIKIGDTLTGTHHPATEPLPGFQEIQPMVFSGIYPINTADFEALKAAMGRLQLNDSSFNFQAESSVALGFGFRCGFLGLLHMEIILERLRREYNMDIIATYPSVIYEVEKTNGEVLQVDNPEFLPDPSVILEIREPIVKCFIMVPNEYISPIMQLIMDKRGVLDHTETLDSRRVMLSTVLPLSEILVDFNDKIKSITRGYGSMDYEHAGHRADKLVKLDILVNGEPVDAFSSIVHRDKAESRGRQLASKLKEVIPTQLYQVAIQAAIGGKIIARESVSASRKDVTAKCYGGDISRKRKLLEKQKEGKKRMKSIGKVNIPQEAFIEVLKAG